MLILDSIIYLKKITSVRIIKQVPGGHYIKTIK